MGRPVQRKIAPEPQTVLNEAVRRRRRLGADCRQSNRADITHVLDRPNNGYSELAAPPTGATADSLTLRPLTATASLRRNF
jgi:hypothetical protein